MKVLLLGDLSPDGTVPSIPYKAVPVASFEEARDWVRHDSTRLGLRAELRENEGWWWDYFKTDGERVYRYYVRMLDLHK